MELEPYGSARASIQLHIANRLCGRPRFLQLEDFRYQPADRGRLTGESWENVNYLRPYRGFAAIQQEERWQIELQFAPGVVEPAVHERAHPNWAQIGQAGGLQLNPTSSQFGQVTAKSTTNPRNIQVGLRLLF